MYKKKHRIFKTTSEKVEHFLWIILWRLFINFVGYKNLFFYTKLLLQYCCHWYQLAKERKQFLPMKDHCIYKSHLRACSIYIKRWLCYIILGNFRRWLWVEGHEKTTFLVSFLFFLIEKIIQCILISLFNSSKSSKVFPTLLDNYMPFLSLSH